MNDAITAADRIYQDMRDQIAYGDLKPGTRIARRPLASRYGTSSIPVLEAIRRLERDGLVVSHPSWGTLVKAWSIDDIEAAYVVREAVEGHACRLFAERATPVQRVTLEEYARVFDEQARKRDERACIEADLALHLYIVECSGSSFLYQIAETSGVIGATLKSSLYDPTPPGADPGPVGVHDVLVTALNKGDADAAELESKNQVRRALESVLSRLKAKGVDRLDFGSEQ